MTDTLDPRHDALVGVLSQLRSAASPVDLVPYVERVLEIADGARGGPADQRLREIALDRAVQVGLGYGDPDGLARGAATLAAYLRDGTTQPDPGIASAVPDGKSEPRVEDTRYGDVARRRIAPLALHEAVDRAWVAIREDGEHLTIEDSADHAVLDLLELLPDPSLARTTFVAAYVRALGSTVRAQRHSAAVERTADGEA